MLDFKTDREPSDLKDQYERQLTLYCRAFAALRGGRSGGCWSGSERGEVHEFVGFGQRETRMVTR